MKINKKFLTVPLILTIILGQYYGKSGIHESLSESLPISVSGASSIAKISAGDSHTAALKSDGTVWSCGRNNYGQLGDGTTTSRYTPVQVTGLSDVIAISAGNFHTVALKSDGTVWSWGYNDYGQLGDGTLIDKTTPVQVQNTDNSPFILISFYTVRYLDYDGSVISTQTVGHGENATPPANPTREGYGFTGWVHNGQNIISSLDITAQYTANTNTPYKVEHYKENTADDGYTLFETTNHTGKTDTTATALPKAYTNFTQNTTHPSRIVNGNIDGNGTRVLRLYYTLNRYNVKYQDEDGNIIELQTIKHGNNSTLPLDPSKPGYDFNGWIEKP